MKTIGSVLVLASSLVLVSCSGFDEQGGPDPDTMHSDLIYLAKGNEDGTVTIRDGLTGETGTTLYEPKDSDFWHSPRSDGSLRQPFPRMAVTSQRCGVMRPFASGTLRAGK